jgi:hypothetical protein
MLSELPDGTAVRHRGGALKVEDPAGAPLNQIDLTLLRAQAAAVGRAVDAAGNAQERELLEGAWTLPHALLDEIEP